MSYEDFINDYIFDACALWSRIRERWLWCGIHPTEEEAKRTHQLNFWDIRDFELRSYWKQLLFYRRDINVR